MYPDSPEEEKEHWRRRHCASSPKDASAPWFFWWLLERRTRAVKGTETTSCSQSQGTGEGNKLMSLQALQNHESKPLWTSLLRYPRENFWKLHSTARKELARGNFSRPQERETMQELPQRAKKQLGTLRWLRTGSTSSKMNNLLKKEMGRSKYFSFNCSLLVCFVSQTRNFDNLPLRKDTKLQKAEEIYSAHIRKDFLNNTHLIPLYKAER